MVLMPLAYSTPVLYTQLDESITRTNAVLEPIAEDMRSTLECTWDPKTDFDNTAARFVFGVFRAVLTILDDKGVPGVPGWFEWADRGVAAVRDILLARDVRAEADRREAVLRDSGLSGWERVAAMYAPSPAMRSVPRSELNTICVATDGIFGFVGDLVGVYGKYVIDFIRILGLFYDVTTGFDTDYINIFVRYLLYVIAHEIDFIACIVNVDGIDVTDPSTYFFDVYSILACICPEYDDRAEVPSNIPLAVVGCFCGLHGKDNIPDVILECIPWLKQAISDVRWLIGEFTYFKDVTLAGLETAYNELQSGVNRVIGDAQTALAAINQFLGGLGRDGVPDAMRVNITLIYNATCPMRPPRAPQETPSAPRVEPPQFRAGFERKAARRKTHLAAKRDELRARLGDDIAPLLDGTLFANFSEAVARRHGPEIGQRAAVMHRGLGSFLTGLYESWGMPTIHHVFARMTAPEIREGFAAALDVIDAERAVNGNLTRLGARGIGQARVAVRSFMPPAAMAPLIVELRAAGEHAAAEEALQWAGALNSRAWTDKLVRRGTAATKQRRADALRAAAALEQAANDAARTNAVLVHIGGIGGAFIFSIFSQLMSVSATQLIGVGASIVAWAGGLIVTAFPIVLSILGQWAVAFFTVLSGASLEPQNDLVTPLTNVFYPLIANGMYNGYTQSALQTAFASTVSIAERQILWIASDAMRVPLSLVAPVASMDLDPDGVPDGDIVKWLTDKVLNSRADYPCTTKHDCNDGYYCWLNSNPRVKCEENDPFSLAICYGLPLRCVSSANCASGVTCMSPTNDYTTECTPSDFSCQLNFGICATPCFTNSDCDALGGGLQCMNRYTNAFDCTDSDPCTLCSCYEWPLKPYIQIPAPALKTLGVPNCAAIGIDLSDTDYWNLPAVKQHGLTARAIFTMDSLRFHLRCFRITFQTARVLLGWIVNGWNVKRTTIYAGIMSHAFVVLPTAPFSWASRTALGGDLISGLVGGQSGFQSLGETLQAWPWPVYYIGDFCVYVATYTPTGDEPECVFAASGPVLWTAGDLVLFTPIAGVLLMSGAIGALLALAWIFFFTPMRIFFAFSRVWYAGTMLSRHHALPSSGTVIYASAPDAIGVVHRRGNLPRAHPLRHRHHADVAAIPGIHVRPAQKAGKPRPWAEAIGEGLDIAMRSTRHIAARNGRVAAHEWPEVIHDEHGPIGKRLLMVTHE